MGVTELETFVRRIDTFNLNREGEILWYDGGYILHIKMLSTCVITVAFMDFNQTIQFSGSLVI